MDLRTLKELESYTKLASKYEYNHPNRGKWYLYTFQDLMDHWIQMVDLIPSNATSILEIGCGLGILGDMIVKKYPNIKYQGFDIVEENIKEAKMMFPNINFYQGNYWNVLIEHEVTWDFIISCSTLFTTTDLKYAPLLFDVLHNKAEKGFSLYALGGTWGIPAKLRDQKMSGMIYRSNNVNYFYVRGKRNFLDRSLLKRNIPLLLWRDSIKEPIATIIPKILTKDIRLF